MSIGLLLFSIELGILYFDEVFARTSQAVEDLYYSFHYYAASVVGKKKLITPTVNMIPANAVEVLPFDPYVFKAEIKGFCKLLVSKQNVKWFGVRLLAVSAFALPVLMMTAVALLLVILLVKLLSWSYDKKNYNKDTFYKRAFVVIEDVTWQPIKRFLRGYVEFLREEEQETRRHILYVVAIALVWAYNLNLLTIALELCAFGLYLPPSQDFMSILTQVAKLAMDLTVVVDFFPPWAWVLICGWAFNALRNYVAYKKLCRLEKKNREFLRAHHGAIFVTGKQRIGKTRAIVDMALSQEQEFREQAKNGLLKREKQFPFFPWQLVDKMFLQGLKRHRFPTAESCEDFVAKLHKTFKYRKRWNKSKAIEKGILRHYRKTYGYTCDDFIFNYDYKRYGLCFNDGLVMVNVFEAIEGYMKNLWLYAAPTSLIFSTIPIRTDIRSKKKTCFPKLDGDFFKRKPTEVIKISKWSHMADQDAFRLGQKKDPNNPQRDGFEAGILVSPEIGKERGNQITNRQNKKKDDECSTANDGYENNIKMLGHSATIDNYTFFRAFYDDQRPESLGADNRDLCDICIIRELSKGKVILPFSGIERILGLFVKLGYDKPHMKEKEKRVNNTLSGYLLRKLFTPIFQHLTRVENKYTVYTAKMKIRNDMLDEVLEDSGKYYIMSKKIHAARYATDGIKNFYTMKAKRSKMGLNEFKTFDRLHMTYTQMGEVRSHFYDDVQKQFEAA